MQYFFHSGELGDVIYGLPTVKAMGGGAMCLDDDPAVKTMHGMTRERYDAIQPLLDAQPYVSDVQWSPPAVSRPYVNLNRFRTLRFDLCHENLADLYLKTEGLPTSLRDGPWLAAPKTRHESVVIARSARYHNDDFPWHKVMDAYGRNAVFVGTPAEHAAFVQQFGSVPYAHTPDLLVAASIINAADLFIGNQSCPLAIAHGLGKKVLIEVCSYCPNCIFKREGEYTEFSHALRESSPASVHVRQTPGDCQGIRGGDTQGSEAARTQAQEALAP